MRHFSSVGPFLASPEPFNHIMDHSPQIFGFLSILPGDGLWPAAIGNHAYRLPRFGGGSQGLQERAYRECYTIMNRAAEQLRVTQQRRKSCWPGAYARFLDKRQVQLCRVMPSDHGLPIKLGGSQFCRKMQIFACSLYAHFPAKGCHLVQSRAKLHGLSGGDFHLDLCCQAVRWRTRLGSTNRTSVREPPQQAF